MKMIQRPTAVALALVNAAAKQLQQDGNKVDHQRWVARSVQSKVENTSLGMKREPAWNAHLSKRTADKLIAEGVIGG